MAALLQTTVDSSLAKGRDAMDDAQRHLLNLRVIRTTFRLAAAEANPKAAAARATMLLGRVRQQTTSADVLDAIAAVQAEIDGHAVEARLQG